MKESLEVQYHDLEKTHFWFKSRRAYILQLLADVPKHSSILDIGCSSGILLIDLIAMGFDSKNLYGIDINPRAIQNCKDNGIENALAMDAQNIELDRQFDIVIASDCLEHLADDEKALKNWHRLLKPDGQLYLFVPAFMSLWSEHDVVNMHYRRYKRNPLKNKLSENGFSVYKSSYWNMMLFPPILIVRWLSRLKKSKQQELTGNLEAIPLFNELLFRLINIENMMLKFINFPFGVSTFCLARKAYHPK